MDNTGISFSIQQFNPDGHEFFEQKFSEKTNNCFRVIWVGKGTGHCLINSFSYAIQANSILFLAPGQSFHLSLGEHPQGYAIYFTQDFVHYHNPYLLSQPVLIGVTTAMDRDLTDIASKMLYEYSTSSPFREDILRGFLQLFFIYINRHSDNGTTDLIQASSSQLVKKFMLLLDKYFLQKKMVADYAKELCISPNYLNIIVKKDTGHSASYHIRQRITLEAKQKARLTDSSMKEIAYYLGFDDIAHFSKFFKNMAGVNFSDFKRTAS